VTRAADWVLTALQQRSLDEASVDAGTSGETLMESAGRHAAEWTLTHRPPESAVVMAGPGGNGGDAFVVARYLLQAGTAVHVFCCRDIGCCTPLTQMMAAHLTRLGVNIHILGTNRSDLIGALEGANCVIDGLLGSGLSRPLSGEVADTVSVLNESAIPIVSLDLPSGLASDSGDVPGLAIRANVTLAMAFYKPSHWLYPAAEYCGDTHVVGVDYPRAELSQVSPLARVHNVETIGRLLPQRVPTGHKGTFGHVLAICGSQGMTGAAILCARGALRAGAGLVTLAVPETILSVIQLAIPEAITIPLPDDDGRLVDPGILERLQPAMERADVLAVGPGLSRDPGTLELVRQIVGTFRGTLIIDADAVRAFADHSDLLSNLGERAVLTPHPGEFAVLAHSTSKYVDASRLEAVQNFVKRCPVQLVLKGRPTVVGLPDQSVIVNPTGNTGLATGGSGDVLTGVMAGLVANGSSTADAAVTAPFIHGLAADRWADEFSERSLTPSDVLEALPRILKELEP